MVKFERTGESLRHGHGNGFSLKAISDAPASLYERAINELYQQMMQRSGSENNSFTYEDTEGNIVTITLDASGDFLMISDQGDTQISLSVIDGDHIEMALDGFGDDGGIAYEATEVLASSGETNVSVSGIGAAVDTDNATIVLLEDASATIEGSNLEINVADGADLNFFGDNNVVTLGAESSANGTGSDNALFFNSADVEVIMNDQSMAAEMDSVVSDASNNTLADLADRDDRDDEEKRKFYPTELRRVRKDQQSSLQFNVDRMKESMAQFQLGSHPATGAVANSLSPASPSQQRSLALAAPNLERPVMQSGSVETLWRTLAVPEGGSSWLYVPQR